MASSFHHPPPPQVYTPSQIAAFLSHIGLPRRFFPSPTTSTSSTDPALPAPSLPLLHALHTHTISTLPYENLAIHYSPTHRNSLDPQLLFEKAVLRGRGRGGFCMENALLYYHVLRGLGFDVYTVGARTRERDAGMVPSGDFPGWVHIVNIVTLPTTHTNPDGTTHTTYQRYHVDIAFGGDGALLPMPLTPGLVHDNLGAQQIRLVKEYISTQTHRPQDAAGAERHKLWIYQYRNGPDQEWSSYYCFPEIEFMAMDWEVVNWWTSTNERSLQTRRPLCILFLRQLNEDGDVASERSAQQHGAADTGDYHIYGKRMLVAGVVKENLGGKTRVLTVCETEQQRVAALREYFSLTLTDEEANGITGFRTELRKEDTAANPS
ncbi:hypothetical protein Micbo1qcDRAFT_196924 [Microdochium bolleyi]|uniref:Uncharacterized protein n=1 Tax=Microdochium bolleyi TaxID=196109 RepID=A0A136IW91_9PEZI|nr:hypothetical protein Micbo1qcDRAFT_196924 [Microdochium bolleyi]